NPLLFSIRGMRLAHMHNAKSREHAHTCRKARAIFKLRYKKNQLSGSVVLMQLPGSLNKLHLANNRLSGSLDLTRLISSMARLNAGNNSFSGTVNLSQLSQGLKGLFLSSNELSDEVFISDKLFKKLSVRGTKLIMRIE
ncbi:hypothetical protein XU18_2491, partial [Perkinsela sp. CCAP 1560/4]